MDSIDLHEILKSQNSHVLEVFFRIIKLEANILPLFGDSGQKRHSWKLYNVPFSLYNPENPIRIGMAARNWPFWGILDHFLIPMPGTLVIYIIHLVEANSIEAPDLFHDSNFLSHKASNVIAQPENNIKMIQNSILR